MQIGKISLILLTIYIYSNSYHTLHIVYFYCNKTMKRNFLYILLLVVAAQLTVFSACKSKGDDYEYENTAGQPRINVEKRYKEIRNDAITALESIKASASSSTTFQLSQELKSVENTYESAYKDLYASVQKNLRKLDKLKSLYRPLTEILEYGEILNLMKARNNEILAAIEGKYWINASTADVASLFRIEQGRLNFVHYNNIFPFVVDNGNFDSNGVKIYLELDGVKLVARDAEGTATSYREATVKEWVLGSWMIEGQQFSIKGDGSDNATWTSDNATYSIDGNTLVVSQQLQTIESRYAYVNKTTGEIADNMDSQAYNNGNYDYRLVDVPSSRSDYLVFKLNFEEDNMQLQTTADTSANIICNRAVIEGPENAAFIFGN